MRNKLILSALLLVTFLPQGCHTRARGRNSEKQRIVGGTEAAPGAWPWQALLFCSDDFWICGGSLINHDWILSAAHCIDCEVRSIRLGVHNVSDPNNPHVEYRRVARWESYHSYNCSGNEESDIVLIKMNSSVSYTKYIQPVSLAQKDSTFHTGVSTWVTGWGQVGEAESVNPDVLQEVSVPIVGENECLCNYNESLPDKILCAGYEEGGKDACFGDSGGPLVVKGDSVWIQAGVVSFGIGCARPDLPGAYTKVSGFQDWIESVVGTVDPPNFVTFTSPGEDSDKKYNCTNKPSKVPPCTVTTVFPTTTGAASTATPTTSKTTTAATTTTVAPTTAATTTIASGTTTTMKIICLFVITLNLL